jgi:hypothetical protein
VVPEKKEWQVGNLIIFKDVIPGDNSPKVMQWKVTQCSPSYESYRPKTNAVIIIGHGSHSNRTLCTGGIGEGKET